jgi:hypothetical protein
MQPVQQVIPHSLAAIIRKAPLCDEKVAFAWRTAVGPAVDRVTSAVLEADGVLRVRAKDPSWEREVERSAAVVRHRMAALLGTGVVRRIDVVRTGSR